MNKNNVLGILLLFLLVMAYSWLSAPDADKVAAYNRYQDSIKQAQAEQYRLDSIKQAQVQAAKDSVQGDSTMSQAQRDSLMATFTDASLREQFGDFAPAAAGEEKTVTIENDKLLLTFSTKGGRIVSAAVKGFEGYNHATADRYDRQPVVLFNNPNDKFEFYIPMASAKRGDVSTSELYFEPIVEGKTIRLRAYASPDKSKYLEQSYTLADGYMIKYNLHFEGLGDMMPRSSSIRLNWISYLNKIEKNDEYERRMSSVHFKEAEENPSYCTCASTVQNEKHEKPLKWVSHAQQFFNMSLLADGSTTFSKGEFSSIMSDPTATHLKEMQTTLDFPALSGTSGDYTMQIFLGPNDYDILAATDTELENIIPFGWSIFGALGKYVIRPLFNFLATFIPSYGLIIIILTLIIRVAIYPLQYKMLLSGVKMSLLRPELEALRKKHGDNQQAMQMEQMKMYNQYGVNPLGGCLPMLLTMPVWMALYRFFPASIEFRQKPFLWAEDLASYDSIFDFGQIPIISSIYGDHVSLFTLLWAISMFAFVKYNASQMDMSAAGGNPSQMRMMMMMQYAFPVVFFFALNSWAAGLTAYMLFSNFLNIAQTYITKNFVINKEKVRAQMEENKKNPKASAWQQQYEAMAKQYQEQQKNQPKK